MSHCLECVVPQPEVTCVSMGIACNLAQTRELVFLLVRSKPKDICRPEIGIPYVPIIVVDLYERVLNR